MVLIFTGISLMLLTGILLWSSANGRLAARYNEYYASVRAAEAATEKVIAHMASDFQQSGIWGVNSNLSSYATLVPTSAESGGAISYGFNDPTGPSDRTYVAILDSWRFDELKWKYTGFQGNYATYRIISNARRNGTGNNIVGAVKQDVEIASIPLFGFGTFYALDMEVSPGVNFQVSGRAHCNGTIYCQPSANLTFADHVTASKSILHEAHPQDSTSRIFGSVTYLAEHDGGATSLNLPLGSGIPNSSANLHKLIEVPSSDDRATPIGQQRYYNKADLIIKVSNGGVVAHSGGYNNFFTSISTNVIANFLTTTSGFTDRREAIDFVVTEVDISRFITNYSTLMNATNLNGHDVRILYIADQRSQVNKKFAVRVTKGQTLPSGGLTIATMNPLYVKGHFNAPDTTPGLTNTSGTQPASLVGDAITILSMNWQDNQSNSGISARNAANTTINAALISGIVQTTNGVYSGGVENCFRLLEDWTGNTLTYNGSTVVLFDSQIATAPWDGSGVVVYKRPTRAYSFDSNFKIQTALPPGTPYLRTVTRTGWSMIQPNSTQ